MWSNVENIPSNQRPDRPTGVVVLSILDGLAAGIAPAFSSAAYLIRSAGQAADQLSLIGLCSGVVLPIAVITAAIGAYRGSDPSRLALLFLITIHASLQVFQILSFSIAGIPQPGPGIGSLGRGLAAFLLMAVNIWYFLRPNTVAFYRRSIRPAA